MCGVQYFLSTKTTISGKKIDIMLGGGRASWQPRDESSTRWDYDTYDWNCTRLDGRNLIQEWEGNHTGGVYVQNRDELMNLTYSEDSVLGIFSNSYVYWDNEVNDTNNIPRLALLLLLSSLVSPCCLPGWWTWPPRQSSSWSRRLDRRDISS